MNICWRNPRQFWQRLLDLAFRLRLFTGSRVPVPSDLCACRVHKQTDFSIVYRCELNPDHPLSGWLSRCDGPWAVGLFCPYTARRGYIAFARKADASLFRLMQD